MPPDFLASQSRVANFLRQLTVPVEVELTSAEADVARQPEILNLVLAIVVDAGFGLSLEPVGRSTSRRSRPIWRLVSERSGARFRVWSGENGGYDLEVLLCGAAVGAKGLTFEALAMALRSFAMVRCQPEATDRPV